VSDGRVFTQAKRGTNEICVALSVTNGTQLWSTVTDVASYPNGGVGTDDGPRSTPAVVDGSVYVLSSYLKLYRLNATNGTIIWQRNLVSLYGGTVISYQNCASPVIENGLVFLNAGTTTSSLMAFRTTDGSLAWRSQDEGMTHSTPVLATIQGVRQIIFFTQHNLVSLDPQSGTLLWRFAYPFNFSFGSLGVSPVVYQDMVFVCGAHAYGVGSVALQVALTDGLWTTTQLWKTNNPAAHWMTPVCHEGFLYGQFGIQTFDSVNAQLKCVDLRTGDVKWSTNGFGRGATVLVNNHVLSLTEKGQLVLVKPDTNAYIEVARCLAIPNWNDTTNKCWNSPAVSDGRVLARSTYGVACFDFSIPALRLDPLQRSGPDQFQLSLRTVNGTPIDSNRLAGLEVHASSDLTQSLSDWVRLTNTLALSNGVAILDRLDALAPTRYFIVNEPP
jgi:outer membrane protein assembly factor BamB